MIHWLFFKTVYVPVRGSLGYVGSKHECTGTRTGSQALIKMHYRNEMLQFSISCVVQNPLNSCEHLPVSPLRMELALFAIVAVLFHACG